MAKSVARKRKPGPPPRYPAIPVSMEVALRNLQQGLGREKWEELIQRAFRALHAAMASARVPRLRRALSALEEARAELDLLAHESGFPAIPKGKTIIGEAIEAEEKRAGNAPTSKSGSVTEFTYALERQARQQVGVAVRVIGLEIEALTQETARAVASGGRPPKPGSVSLRENPLQLVEPWLAGAVADLEWVTGTDLVQLAIAVNAEPPLSDHGEVDARRQKWDDRLRQARRRNSGQNA